MYEPLIKDCFLCSCLFTHETPEVSAVKQSGWKTDVVNWFSKHDKFNCIACGEYSIRSSPMDEVVRDTDMLIKIRHFLAVHKAQSENDSSEKELIKLTDELLSSIKERSLLTPPEQMDNMIRFFGGVKKSKRLSKYHV